MATRARDRYLIRDGNRLLVHARRWRQAGLAAFCLYFGLVGLLIVGASAADLAASLAVDPLWGLGIGTAVAVSLGRPGATLARRALRNAPALVIDSNGVTLPDSPIGHLPWAQITGYRAGAWSRITGGVLGPSTLRILMRDPAEVLSRVPQRRRSLCRLRSALTGSPVRIPLMLLPLDVNELITELERYRPGTEFVAPARPSRG